MRSTRATLRAIENLTGLEECKEYAQQLAALPQLRANMHLPAIPLPNLMISAPAGSEIDSYAASLAQLLADCELMPFIGEEKHFSWNYTNDSESLESLVKRIRLAGGFYGMFQGVVCLHLLNPAPSSGDIRRLLDYAFQLSGKVMFIFALHPDTDEDARRKLTVEMAARIPIRSIVVRAPDIPEMAAYAVKCISGLGFIVTDSAQSKLQDIIGGICHSSRFAGYITLAHLANDIAWHQISSARPSPVIDAADLSYISQPDGMAAIFKPPVRRTIGFGEKE